MKIPSFFLIFLSRRRSGAAVAHSFRNHQSLAFLEIRRSYASCFVRHEVSSSLRALRDRCLLTSPATLPNLSFTSLAPLQGTSSSVTSSRTSDAINSIVTISDAYDGGNGEFISAEVVDCDDDDCDVRVNVKIRPDP